MCTVGRKLAAYQAARLNLIREIKKGRNRKAELAIIEKKIKALKEAAKK